MRSISRSDQIRDGVGPNVAPGPGGIPRLPPAPTSLIGRDAEIGEMQAALHDPTIRLVTLLGPGGVGKTRLAVRVAAEMARAGKHRVHFVALAPITDPATIMPSIAGAIGASGPDDEPTIERVADVIGTTETLLVLDNFERLVDAGPILSELLSLCPGLTLLVTSRAMLRLIGEHVIPVKPLVTPPRGAPPDQIAGFPSVQLFLERSDHHRQRGTGERANSELLPIAEICRKLDGLPLAIELAAARTRIFSPRQLLEHLDSGIAVLRHGPRDAPPRLQSMHDMIAWSYDLLSDNEQVMLRLLSVFSGGFTFRAVAEIYGQFRKPGDKALQDSTLDWTGGAGDTLVADLLLSLVDQSLVDQIATDDGRPRFSLLETIREFGRERLAARGETDRACSHHAKWFAALARSRQPSLISFPTSPAADPLHGEHDNVRTALAWSLEQNEHQLAGWLACGIWPYWFRSGLLSEASDTLAEVLHAHETLSPELHADLLLNSAVIMMKSSQLPRAVEQASQAMRIYESVGNQTGIARCLCYIGNSVKMRDPVAAVDHLARSAQLLRTHGDDSEALVRTLGFLGNALFYNGDLAGAQATLSEAHAIAKAAKEHHSGSAFLGWLALAEGDFDRAGVILREVIEYDQFIVDPAVRMLSLRLLGRLELLQGRPVEAGRYYHQALTIAAEAETPIEVSHNLAELAAVAQSCGDSGKAARWMAFDACQIQRLERRLSSDEAALRLTTREAALAHLGPAEFASAWESGETLSTTDAVAEALAWHPEEKPLKPSTADLTRREQQVLDLLADHRTNKEIADCLFISERTVETHVANVLSKLGVQSRWDAVDVARSRDLLEN